MNGIWARPFRSSQRDRLYPGKGYGPWHWIITTLDDIQITACGLFTHLDELVVRDDRYANHRCTICNLRKETFEERLQMHDASDRPPGWIKLPEYRNGVLKEHTPGSRKMRVAAKKIKDAETQVANEGPGIKAAIPALARRRDVGHTLPVLVEYWPELGDEPFMAFTPVASEFTVTSDNLGEALALIGQVLQDELHG